MAFTPGARRGGSATVFSPALNTGFTPTRQGQNLPMNISAAPSTSRLVGIRGAGDLAVGLGGGSLSHILSGAVALGTSVAEQQRPPTVAGDKDPCWDANGMMALLQAKYGGRFGKLIQRVLVTGWTDDRGRFHEPWNIRAEDLVFSNSSLQRKGSGWWYVYQKDTIVLECDLTEQEAADELMSQLLNALEFRAVKSASLQDTDELDWHNDRVEEIREFVELTQTIAEFGLEFVPGIGAEIALFLKDFDEADGLATKAGVGVLALSPDLLRALLKHARKLRKKGKLTIRIFDKKGRSVRIPVIDDHHAISKFLGGLDEPGATIAMTHDDHVLLHKMLKDKLDDLLPGHPPIGG
ncbi:MAG: hypothetical protein HUU15_19585, partial [Candidatus Brocadiae bacterium]|nr:hypothetical protein [Candidatus Brocadiia bacterium]